ncbi:hypothetical protein [Sphingomonas crocodyli]|uniref:DUF3558 domain-containing protein n=1 Tax=Sphingomonas crocodyli TaxID=1979270 RepID=A0A437LXU8_9SPHN|nr:hypothetical protein [Sphingomonas crocodyli]RVT90248.1 hypothetical protein EOD43_18310 [Sphingomonas crocodyli]
MKLMRQRLYLFSVALGLFGLVSGCGGGGGAMSGKPEDWAADACKTFPADVAGKVAGVSVKKAESAGQTGNERTLVSNCTYSSADDRTSFAVLLRQAKSDGESVDDQITGLKSQPDMTGPSEDVNMPKGRAIWAPKLRTLSYVPAVGRMIVVTPPGAIAFGSDAGPSSDLKAKAIAIASAIEG